MEETNVANSKEFKKLCKDVLKPEIPLLLH